MEPLISVIVPARNAETTLARTLRSALRQTYRNIEILVVNDGSSDRTEVIAWEHSRRDARVRIVQCGGNGVAAARNIGIAHARGDFIAPLDADDLWHPKKIELQVGAYVGAPAKVGLVYNFSRIVDDADRVIGENAVCYRGDVLLPLLRGNFIGNGSTPLIRRSALPDPAYEPALRAAGLEGCEDYLLQLKLAVCHHFVCLPLFLTGYRWLPTAMSRDDLRMIRSRLRTLYMIEDDLPKRALPTLRRERSGYHVRLARRAAMAGTIREFGQHLDAAFAEHSRSAFALIWQRSLERVRNSAGATPSIADPGAAIFDDVAPDVALHPAPGCTARDLSEMRPGAGAGAGEPG